MGLQKDQCILIIGLNIHFIFHTGISWYTRIIHIRFFAMLTRHFHVRTELAHVHNALVEIVRPPDAMRTVCNIMNLHRTHNMGPKYGTQWQHRDIVS